METRSKAKLRQQQGQQQDQKFDHRQQPQARRQEKPKKKKQKQSPKQDQIQNQDHRGKSLQPSVRGQDKQDNISSRTRSGSFHKQNQGTDRENLSQQTRATQDLKKRAVQLSRGHNQPRLNLSDRPSRDQPWPPPPHNQPCHNQAHQTPQPHPLGLDYRQWLYGNDDVLPSDHSQKPKKDKRWGQDQDPRQGQYQEPQKNQVYQENLRQREVYRRLQEEYQRQNESRGQDIFQIRQKNQGWEQTQAQSHNHRYNQARIDDQGDIIIGEVNADTNAILSDRLDRQLAIVANVNNWSANDPAEHEDLGPGQLPFIYRDIIIAVAQNYLRACEARDRHRMPGLLGGAVPRDQS